jgi:hypothetical protein
MVRHSKRRYVGPTKKEKYLYPTRFGSHSLMIDEEKTSELNDENKVVLLDEHGYYITSRDRLDSGGVDPRRYVTSRLKF